MMLEEKGVGKLGGDNVKSQAGVIGDYKSLYSSKHFRNRIIRLQKLCELQGLDAIVLILGMDSRYDGEMVKLQNWLCYGKSTYEVHGSSPGLDFQDSFFVISKDSFQAFTNSAGFKRLSELVTLVPNVNLHTVTKSEENDDPEKLEVIKMTKFYEMVHDKKSIGMPVRQVTAEDRRAKNEGQLVEQWPMIQAYGLDMVGNGFFTMKHQFSCVREQLWEIYAEFDTFSLSKVLFDDASRLNQTYFDNFYTMNVYPVLKRIQMTEHDLVNAFRLDGEFCALRRRTTTALEQNAEKMGIPAHSRVLIGSERTNASYEVESDKTRKIWKLNENEDLIKTGQSYNTDSCLHFTLEWTDVNTGLRFARTMFLTTLVADDYMKDVHLSPDEESHSTNQFGRENQKNTKVLFHTYVALQRAHQELAHALLNGEMTPEQLLSGHAVSVMSSQLKNFGGVLAASNLPNGVDKHLQVDLHQYDAYGRMSDKLDVACFNKLMMLRMQLKNIKGVNGDIGSVVYAQSFFWIDPKTYLCVTKNVPNTQFFITSHKHFVYTPLPILTEKNIQCELLGDKLTKGTHFYENILGMVPVCEELNDVVHDQILMGKLQFYEEGFIYTEKRQGAFFIPYADLEAMTYYLDESSHTSIKNVWIQFSLKTADKIPCAGLMAKDNLCFYIFMPYAFYKERFQPYQEYFGEAQKDAKVAEMQADQAPVEEKDGHKIVRKVSEECTRVTQSFALKNLFANRLIYDVLHGSEFLNPSFDRDLYTTVQEFETIQEFNVLKGKAESQKSFVEFTTFKELHEENVKKPSADTIAGTLPKLLLKLKRKDAINVILVSGIPGSGKGRFAAGLSRHLNNEQLNTSIFKMPTVQHQTHFDTQVFVDNLQTSVQEAEKSQERKLDVVVAVLPSYHHLKKAIFEIRKTNPFAQKQYDIKFVITKVSARNFYMNRNRNQYQFLVENCLKGVSHAVVFERGSVMPQTEIAIMQSVLADANFAEGVLATTGKSFDLGQLSQVLMRQNDKLNLLYTKYFYGFEKEGRSNYFFEKAVHGHYFNYRYPIKESMIRDTIMKVLNEPLTNFAQMGLRPEAPEDAYIRAKKEEQAAAELEERIQAMSSLEKRRYKAEEKRKARVLEDAAPEKLLRDEIEKTKAKITGRAMVFERLRGLVTLEDDETQDYELLINFSEVSLKPLKNTKERLTQEQLGFMIYGSGPLEDNEEKVMRELLKMCKTQIAEKRRLLKVEDLTQEELTQIQKAHFGGEELPAGWYFQGALYVDEDGKMHDEHPETERFVKEYLAEKNDKIGDFNRDLVKQRRAEKKHFGGEVEDQ